MAESIDLKAKLVNSDVNRQRPDCFHARTGHELPVDQSKVLRQLLETENYTENNGMKINASKTKVMLFNPASSLDFMPDLNLGDRQIDVVDELKVLGLIVRADLKWSSNTDNMVLKGYKRVWMLKRLKQLGAKQEDLLDVFIKQVRSVLELAVPVWHPSLTLLEKSNIERVQKAALYIILAEEYTTYREALAEFNLESLEDRRIKLCTKFAKKAVRNDKFSKWFKVNDNYRQTRQKKPKYCPVWARTVRFQNSPLSYLTTRVFQKIKSSIKNKINPGGHVYI